MKPQQQTKTPNLCNDCRRKTTKGTKVIKGISYKREFCYSKQLFLENTNPIICNGFKKNF